ncbi:hypothetical protein IOCL1545_000076200 [Leishmania shawi]|uniref:Uncharacterized protein n=1 Tax=Leishmania shawi TaxID=5680 RepID=A0ABR3EG19_9TRYP
MSKSDLAKDSQAPLPAMVLRFGDDVGDASYPEAALVVEGIAAPCKAETKKVNTGHQPPRRDFRSGLFDCHESWAVCLDACLCTYCVASAHHNFLMNDTAGVYFPACCGLLCVDAGAQRTLLVPAKLSVPPHLPHAQRHPSALRLALGGRTCRLRRARQRQLPCLLDGVAAGPPGRIPLPDVRHCSAPARDHAPGRLVG